MANDGGSNVGKYLVYLGVGAGVVAAAYYLLNNWITNPVNEYVKMYTDQYDALMQKMKTYTTTNPDGWSASQQQNVATENSILAQTAAGLADASKGVYDLANYVVAGVVAIGVSAIVAKNVVSYFKNRSGGQVRTAQACAYCGATAIADSLMQAGYPIRATNLIASAQQTFQAYDLPYMQATVQSLEASLPALSGVQLIVAQQMIEALSIEMAVIPAMFVMPMPII